MVTAAIPVRTQTDVEVFGQLFERHLERFYRVHEGQFTDFLKANGLSDKRLAELNVEKKDLARQWCAAEMGFYLFRYGGMLGVHYLSEGERKHAEVRVEEGPPVKTAALRGSRFGQLIPDVLSGRLYATPDTLAPFTTFGDCDEMAAAIGHFVQAVNQHQKLDMQVELVPAGTHAFLGVRFNGIPGKEGKPRRFYMDPTMVVEAGEDRYPRAGNPSAVDISGEPMDERETERYARIAVPQLNAQMRAGVGKLRISPSQARRIDSAMEFTSRQPHEVLAMAREANVRLWNRDRREDEIRLTFEREDLVKNLAPLRASHGTEAVKAAAAYVATFFADFQTANRTLQTIMDSRLSLDRKVALLKDVIAPAIAQGRTNVDEDMQRFLAGQQRVAMR